MARSYYTYPAARVSRREACAGDRPSAGFAERLGESPVARSGAASGVRCCKAVPADVEGSRPEAASTAVERVDGQGAGEGRALPEGRALAGRFARFKRLYESRDRRLCVFEDARGHLAAVKTSRLA